MKKPTDPTQLKTIKLFAHTVEEALSMGATLVEAEQRAFSLAGDANPRFAAKGPVWVPKQLTPRLVRAFGKADKRAIVGKIIHSSWGPVKIGRPNGTGIWVQGEDGMVAHVEAEEFVRYNPSFTLREVCHW